MALFIPSLSGGGAERATATIAGGLDEALFEPILLLERGGSHVYAVGSSVAVHSLGVTKSRRTLGPLVSFLRREQPDILYSALPHLNILAALGRQFVHPKPHLVVSVHSNQERELATVRNGAVMRLIMPWVYRSADAVVVVSSGIADELRSVVGRSEKLQRIYDPLDVARVVAMAQEDVRHPWFDGNHEVISAMGRLSPEKGFLSLVRAFATVRERRPTARLLIMGDGDQADEIVALAQDLGVAEQVQLLGFQQNPFAYIARSTCFVMSSSWEGFGMAIVEAMASGTAVLSTDCPYGPSEILEGGKYGLLVRPGSIDDLAEGISRLLNDQDLRRDLAEHGKARAMDFDVGTVLPMYSDLLRQVGRRPPQPS